MFDRLTRDVRHATRLAAAFPESNKDKTFVAMPLRDNLVRDARTTLYALMGAVALGRRDVRQASPASRPGFELYIPLRQHPYVANEIQMVVRAHVDAAAMATAVQKIVRDANPEVAMKFLTLDDSVSRSIAAPRFRATLVSTFASLALLLAIAGVYAVISYTTAQRTPEFGLRVAIGARTIDILSLVLRGAGGLAVMGLGIGLVLALISSRVIAAMLFGVTQTDTATYFGGFAITLPLVIAAAAIPAWGAARVDPLTAFRAD